MSLPRGLCALCLVAVLGAGGCSTARLVSCDSTGGVVAMPSNTDMWPTHYRKSAEEIMAKKFPQGYVIEGEGEVVVGQRVTDHVTGNNNSAASTLFGINSENHDTQTHDIKEWQIRFRAKDAPAVAARPPVGPPSAVVQTQAVERLPDVQQSLPPTPVPVVPH